MKQIKLNPISSSRFLSDKHIIADNESIQSCIADLTVQISRLQKKIDHNDDKKRIEERFQDIQCQIPNFPQDSRENSEIRKLQMKKWLGEACKKIFSIGFSLFQKGVIDFKKLNAYCSQNLLYNILKLSQKNKFNSSDFSFINKFLEEQILPYFLLKYPLSEQSQASDSFSKKIVAKDNKLNCQNDLLYRSKVKFQWDDDQNYNQQIMSFLNFVMDLPDMQIEQNTMLVDMFYKDMEQIFTWVEKEDNMIQKKTTEVQNDTEKLKAEKKYRQDVRAYTEYKIGRKLAKNLPRFKENQIKSGNLKVKNTSLMRVMTKWSKQLQKYFDQKFIINRQEPFRMRDGSTKFLTKEYLIILSKFLQQQWVKIQRYLEQMMINNYQNQQSFSKKPLHENFIGFSNQEGSVGQFSSKIFRNNENYLIGYLNSLIHGILSARKNFQKIMKVIHQSNESDKISKQIVSSDNIQQMLFKFSQQMHEKYEQIDVSQEVPEIITFMLGDILRCKCSSHENQIIAIFDLVEKIGQEEPEKFRIVRIKNRLQSGTKDILMNIMYRGTLLIEMQLAIKTDKSKFVDCSNSFAHYIYELMRGQFGPISEMANIWINLDLRGNFYLKKLEQFNDTIENKKTKQCCERKQNMQPIKFPFHCTTCQFYYSYSAYIEDHIKCKKCLSFKCLNCRLNASYDQVRKVLTFLPEFSSNTHIQSCQKVPSEGLLVGLKSKQRRTYFFKKIKKNRISFIFVKGQKGFDLISVIRNSKQHRKFERQHYIAKSEAFKQYIPQITEEEANKNFFMPYYLEKCQRLQKDSISVVKQGASDQLFSSSIIKDSTWPFAKRINFSENKFKSADEFFEKFKNIQIAVLNMNKIKELSEHCRNLKKVQELHLRKNEISIIHPAISECSELIVLDLQQNKLDHNIEPICGLKKLLKLNLSSNKMQSLPQSIGKLKKLKQIYIQGASLKQIPQSFGDMNELAFLTLENNQLSQLPENFGNLKLLRTLIISQNKLEKLPKNFGNLTLLQYLDISNNNLTVIKDEDIKTFKQIIKLKLSRNKIRELPQNIGQLDCLQQIKLDVNQIKELPKSISRLKKLKIANLQVNKISKLPGEMKDLHQLQILNLGHNELEQLPESIANIVSLKRLTLDHNKILKVHPDIVKMVCLKTLDLSYNEELQVPEYLSKVISLKHVFLSKTKIKNNIFPSFLCSLSNLKTLHILNVELLKLPQQIVQLTKLKQLCIIPKYLDEASNSIRRQVQSRIKSQVNNHRH